jgi:Domain of unknown function (DUF4126)
MDIGQGAGLSAASGIRPFLPPLLAGALARGDVGLDFDGTSWHFLESPGFLLAVFALAVLSYGAERSLPNRRPLTLGLGILGLALAALLFAGSLAEGGHAAWPGLVAGVACAALAWLGVGGLLERTRRRLDPGGSSALAVCAEATALVLAAIAIALPPLSFAALAGLLILLAGGRRQARSKYAGLRILR